MRVRSIYSIVNLVEVPQYLIQLVLYLSFGLLWVFQAEFQDMDEACVQGEGVDSADQFAKDPSAQESEDVIPKYVFGLFLLI